MPSLYEYLSTFVSEHRKALIEKNSALRTRYITVVLEDIYQSQNASAVVRTADCFGIQDIHVIENVNEYNINPQVSLGANKWVNLHRYNETGNNTLKAIKALKHQGYRIIATTPHKNDVSPEDFDIEKGKVALLFGSEKDGLSDEALNLADEYLKIPMVGFTESFNISVSAAIILHSLSNKLRKSNIPWQLSSEEKNMLMENWIKSSLKKSDLLEKEYIEKFKNNEV